MELLRRHFLKVAQGKNSRAGHNLESSTLEIGPSSFIRRLAEPGRMSDGDAPRVNGAKGRRRSFRRQDHGSASRNSLQSTAKSLVGSGAESVAAAREGIHDR